MLILLLKKNELDQAYIFQDTYFGSSEIYQQTTIYCFKHTKHDILLISFYFKSFTNSFFLRVIALVIISIFK